MATRRVLSKDGATKEIPILDSLFSELPSRIDELIVKADGAYSCIPGNATSSATNNATMPKPNHAANQPTTGIVLRTFYGAAKPSAERGSACIFNVLWRFPHLRIFGLLNNSKT
ncbi:hypothetical protein ACQ4M4_00485 [Leptolyngbya sp. AN02str]|uniref:hypothetical protein n=1 Tax=Leptolyngbya sp. AN02str TaxID=3423363 RepID=UPI003D31B1C6